jgi:hypothetical protein
MTGDVFVFNILASNDASLSSFQSFGAAMPTSDWWSAVSTAYDLGTLSHAELVGAAINPGTVDETWMINYIRQTITSSGRTLGTGLYHGNTISVLYLPDDVVISGNGAAPDCTAYQGYHTYDYVTPDTNFIWAVVQRCAATGNITNVVQNAMSVGSHEIAEAATDPIPPNGYILPSVIGTMAAPPAQDYSPFAYAPPEGEVGDLCFGTYDVEGAFTYQRIWSITAATVGDPCVPAVSTPFECAYTPAAWYPVQPGQSVTVPFYGWSTSTAAQTWDGFAYMPISEPSGAFAINGSEFSINNGGGAGAVYPVAESSAVSGDYAAFEIISYTSATSEQHVWAFGVYVP